MSSANNSSPELGDQVLVALRRIIRATDLHSRSLLRKFGLTSPQLVVLREVAARGALSGSALARAVSVSLPTATGILTRLEGRGLVERRRSETDRRQILVLLTPAGSELLADAPPPLQERFLWQLSSMKDWEKLQMLATLERIVSMMEAEAVDASPVLATGDLAAQASDTGEEAPPVSLPETEVDAAVAK